MTTISLPPYTGNVELDQHLYDITDAINSGNLNGVGGSADGEAIVLNELTGEIMTTDGIILGYQHRYLDVVYGSSATGADRSATIGELPAGTSPVFIGRRNSVDDTIADNSAAYSWAEIASDLTSDTLKSYYKVIGGRDIDFEFQATMPEDYVLHTGGTIDLEESIQGTDGIDAIFVIIDVRMRPADSDPSSIGSTENPLDWAIAVEGDEFRNNMGAEKTLVSTVYLGDAPATLAQHQSYTYGWGIGNTQFTPSVENADRLSRWLPIVADDVDSLAQFVCDVDNI